MHLNTEDQIEQIMEQDAQKMAVARMLYFALNNIIVDLPLNRDWLDPQIESVARKSLAEAKKLGFGNNSDCVVAERESRKM